MADPVTIAVGAFGAFRYSTKIAGAMGEAIQTLHQIKEDYGKIPKEYIELSNQNSLSICILEESALELQRQELQRQDLTPTLVNSITSNLLGCITLGKKLDHILSKPFATNYDSHITKIVSTIYTLQKKPEVRRISVQIDNYVKKIQLYCTWSSSNLNRQENLQKKMSTDNLLRGWLAPPDPSSDLREALKKCAKGTGTWLLQSEKYTEWKDNGWERSHTYAMWIYGPQGCGKTVLSSSVVDDIQTTYTIGTPKAALAYFYFDFQDKTKQDCLDMLRSLISQFLTRTAQSNPDLVEAYLNNEGRGSVGMLTKFLIGILSDPDLRPAYIILDALDECNTPNELVSFLDRLIHGKHPNLQIFFTSRSGAELQEVLEPLVPKDERIFLHAELIDQDIRTYTQQRLHDDRGLQQWHNVPGMHNKIENAITSTACGKFRWAACQLDAISACRYILQITERLQNLPQNLEDSYARILLEIDEADSNDALTILRWLAFSGRPLATSEVMEVLGISLDGESGFIEGKRLGRPATLTQICSSLITVVPGEAVGVDKLDENQPSGPVSYVRLAHSSVKEYLMSDRIKYGPAARYGLRSEESHAILVRSCLTYLARFRVENCPEELVDELHELYPTGVPEDLIPILNGHSSHYDLRSSFPLATYAAKWWIYHLNSLEEASQEILEQLRGPILDFQARTWPISHVWAILWYKDSPWRFRREGWQHLTPLCAACEEGHFFAAQQILQISTKQPDTPGGPLRDPLLLASACGQDTTVELLLSRGADIDAIGDVYSTALMAACVQGREKTVELLLSKGANVDISVDQGAKFYLTALGVASFMGYTGIVRQLISKGVNINCQGLQFRTPLGAAAEEGHEEIVELLLDSGADTKVSQPEALRVASAAGRKEVVELLLRRNPDVNGRRSSAPLTAASANGHVEIAGLLISKGADVEADLKNTPLKAASRNGHKEVAELLLHEGANVNTEGGQPHLTALQAASAGGQTELVKLLLSNGANVNAEGEGTYPTALQSASANGNAGIVELLLSKGANINARSEGQFATALEAAENGGCDDVVELLRSKGAV